MNNREIAEAIWKQHCGVKGFNILDAITQALDEKTYEFTYYPYFIAGEIHKQTKSQGDTEGIGSDQGNILASAVGNEAGPSGPSQQIIPDIDFAPCMMEGFGDV